jgi:fructose 1,6-bisphosphatase
MALLMLTAILGATGISGSEETGTPSQAAGPSFKLAMVTTDKYSRNEKTVFPSDFPRIFAVYQVADVAQGTKLKAVWIAEKVEGLEAKTKITESESTFSAKGEYMGAFSCPKPPQGWLAGTYLVELSLNGGVRKTLTFRVQKP